MLKRKNEPLCVSCQAPDRNVRLGAKRVGWKKQFFYVIMICIGFALAIGLSEGVLRLRGEKPFSYAILDKNEPTMCAFDPLLGWVMKPGIYALSSRATSATPIRYTILEDGSRATTPDAKTASDYDIIFVGDSYTQGFAVSDQDTFAWKIQSKLPSLRVGNFGVMGYGTYQSLLLLQSLFKKGMRPRIVVYGFIGHHEIRNVASAYWLRLLTMYSKRQAVYVPFCSINEEGELQDHKPIKYLELPLRGQLAVVDYLTRKFYELDPAQIKKNAMSMNITKKLLVEMNELITKNGAHFYVAMMDEYRGMTAPYQAFLNESQIKTIQFDFRIDKELQCPEDGHPNSLAHSKYAETITQTLLPDLIDQ